MDSKTFIVYIDSPHLHRKFQWIMSNNVRKWKLKRLFKSLKKPSPGFLTQENVTNLMFVGS